MRAYTTTFNIFFDSKEKQKVFYKYFEELLEYLSSVPYCEHSIKNLVRYVLYFSKVAVFDNEYQLDDVGKLLYKLRIKFEDQDLKKLYRKSIHKIP